MVSSRIAADLPALPTQTRTAQEDFILLPPLRGEGRQIMARSLRQISAQI
jgi:hypothetical protein